jgi:hypothetical protein
MACYLTSESSRFEFKQNKICEISGFHSSQYEATSQKTDLKTKYVWVEVLLVVKMVIFGGGGGVL